METFLENKQNPSQEKENLKFSDGDSNDDSISKNSKKIPNDKNTLQEDPENEAFIF